MAKSEHKAIAAEVKAEKKRGLRKFAASLEKGSAQDGAFQAWKVFEKEHADAVKVMRTFWKAHYLDTGHRFLGRMLVGNLSKLDR